MSLLDKGPLHDRADEDAASPVLVIVVMVLFITLVLAAISLHYETLLAVIGDHGIHPGFVGP